MNSYKELILIQEEEEKSQIELFFEEYEAPNKVLKLQEIIIKKI